MMPFPNLQRSPTRAASAEGPEPVLEPAKLNVVLFSGGSGTQTICDTLLRHGQMDLTVIINAYDDGHSTGRLRRFVRGMLGPSDVRKNINRLMPHDSRSDKALRVVSDFRLPVSMDHDAGLALVRNLAEGRHEILPPGIRPEFELLTIAQASRLYKFFRHFYEYSIAQLAEGRRFDYQDCALGNILFAGCYLSENCDFNKTIDTLSAFYRIRARLLNITRGENYFLAAVKEDGTVLRGEADIVSSQNSAKISELFLIDERIYLDTIEGPECLDDPALRLALEQGRRTPEINPDAAAAIASAGIVLYGPGTQHSSLFPSYLTRGVGEAIASNREAHKVFVSNIRRDFDLPQEDASEILRKFFQAMSRNGEVPLEWSEAATHFFFQQSGTSTGGPQYIPFDPGNFEYPQATLLLRDWETSEGKHAGGYVLYELCQLLQGRTDVELEPLRHLVSIVVPVYNEVRTVAQAVRDLTQLDFHRFGIATEVIVVDGGSTDGTGDAVAACPGAKLIRLESNLGRGAAMRAGAEQARGDTVVFFPADLEYKTEDILRIVVAIVRNEYKAVFGTRNVKCSDLSARLSEIYGNDRGLFMMSKYGGMLLSMATLLLYNRYVSDPLTCLMAFDAGLFRSLDLKADGIDIQTELVAKLCKRNQYILEVPVDYAPRTRLQGKKTTPLDGFQALVPLVRVKYGSSDK